MLATRLADLTSRCADMDYHWIVPVPLSSSRQRKRGFNQAELLAESIPRFIGGDLRRRAMVRRDGPAQVAQSRSQRSRLSSSVFRVRESPFARRVLLVDDVITTGATLRAACRALLDAGALDVHVAAVARTEHHR